MADDSPTARIEELERRLELSEDLRRELGDQVAWLIELLERSREEIRWLRGQLPEEA